MREAKLLLAKYAYPLGGLKIARDGGDEGPIGGGYKKGLALGSATNHSNHESMVLISPSKNDSTFHNGAHGSRIFNPLTMQWIGLLRVFMGDSKRLLPLMSI